MANLTDREKYELIMGETFKMHTFYVANFKNVLDKATLVVESGIAPKEEVAAKILDLAVERLNSMAADLSHLFQVIGIDTDRMADQGEVWEAEHSKKLKAAIATGHSNLH